MIGFSCIYTQYKRLIGFRDCGKICPPRNPTAMPRSLAFACNLCQSSATLLLFFAQKPFLCVYCLILVFYNLSAFFWLIICISSASIFCFWQFGQLAGLPTNLANHPFSLSHLSHQKVCRDIILFFFNLVSR